MEWLTGLHGASPQDVIERIRERGTEFLGAIERARRGRRFRHTFVFAAFVDGVPLVAVISNFEDCSGRSDDYPSPELRVDTRRMAKRPALLVTGRKAAVARASRRRLERVAERTETSPARIRNELSEKTPKLLSRPRRPAPLAARARWCHSDATAPAFKI